MLIGFVVYTYWIALTNIFVLMASILSIDFCVLTVLVTHVLCYDITILHTNDVHARFVQFNNYGTDCSDEDSADGKCFGGVARRQTKVKDIFKSHGRDNVLFMDAGDQFMGTLWFTVYRGMAAAQFMNELDYDVMVTFIVLIALSRSS